MKLALSDHDPDASFDQASATTIALSGSGAQVAGQGASVDGSVVTISAAGTYVLSGESSGVQVLVKDWQQYITDHFYSCTDEILEGLGKMYVADERFAANIDRHGEGTAQCMSGAIAAYIDAKLG